MDFSNSCCFKDIIFIINMSLIYKSAHKNMHKSVLLKLSLVNLAHGTINNLHINILHMGKKNKQHI